MFEFYLRPNLPRQRYGEGDDPPPSPPAPPPVTPPGKTFTQDEVNKLMADNKRGLQEKYKGLEEQYKTMLEKTNLTEQERTTLQQQYESIQAETKTKEELHKTEVQKLQEASTKQINGLKTESEAWKTRFVSQTIGNALLSAASTAKARNVNQILAMFGQAARVEEVLQDGKPTGQFAVKMKISILKDGKQTELDLAPNEALKILAEQPEHSNLFIDPSNPGLGGGQSNGNGRLPSIAGMSVSEYAKNRDRILDSAKGK